MSKNLVIIDADSICYLGGKEDSLQQILEKVDYKIQEILTETKADYYVLLVSKGKYFRHDISKSKDVPEGTYKANRTYGEQIWVKTIKEYLIAKYKGIAYPMLEADDMCCWLMTKNLVVVDDTIEEACKLDPSDVYNGNILNKILVAKDKDLLYSIPGKHLNFSKKLGPDTWGMEWVETSETEARLFKASQLIVGDASDGVAGIKGKGAKYWEGLKYRGATKLHDLLEEYINYFGESQGIYEFQKNYRLLHMLSTDEDMLREVGYIPPIPEFQKVNKPEEIKTNEIDF